ncbi:MAG: hypothetical protein HY959_03580 [Ignavibacteriae bacterium]|nr:hypothetical protein [Ignavibacteriota bacterium]
MKNKIKKIKRISLKTAVILSVLIALNGCGDKLDLAQFPVTNNGTINVSDTVYVQQYPVWGGFNRPEAVYAGTDQLIYVADTKNNSIVQMDVAGGRYGSYYFHSSVFPKKISQDGLFDLLVICDSVTSTDTISILFRLKVVDGGGVITQSTPAVRLLTSLKPTPNTNKLRKFTGISTYLDNSYVITRTGPEDPLNIDPGNAIIKASGRDSVTQLAVLSGFQTSGNSFYSIDKVSSILTIKNNPPNFIISRSSKDTLNLNKVIYFEYNSTNGTYDPKYTSTSQDIVNIKFGSPDAIAMDNNYAIYVIDSYRNYFYKFSSSGSMLKESFGDATKFSSPKGITIFNKVVYIADTGNDRILRYKLSTDN